MKQIYIVLFVLLFTSCAPRIDYLGSTGAPTSAVDVFVDQDAIKKKYDIIGKGYVDTRVQAKNTTSKIQARAIEKAKDKGADAVLIQDYLPENGIAGTTPKKDDPSGNVITVNTTHIRTTGENSFIVYFLKYRQ